LTGPGSLAGISDSSRRSLRDESCSNDVKVWPECGVCGGAHIYDGGSTTFSRLSALR
jgi:hypothetical protein